MGSRFWKGALLLVLLSACTAEGGVGGGDAYPRHCYDGRRNVDETYRDCGGSCAPCPDGAGCQLSRDCGSGVCSVGFCLVASCTDKTKNQDETDVDCGGVTCAPCGADGVCAEDRDCASGVCQGGMCRATSCGDGKQSGRESDLDCGGDCGGCGAGQRCNGDLDCADHRCDAGTCVAGTCTDVVRNQDESDVDCGGVGCARCGDGAKCLGNSDCESGACAFTRCISCDDGLQNGNETGRDCGGPDCGPCRAGEGCTDDGDCISGLCVDHECTQSTCFDGTKNGHETAKDCGGPACPVCHAGEGCAENSDCASHICDGSTCTESSCTDRVKNGGESDIDCGGATTCPRCRDFRECAIPSDCASSTCNVDGECGSQRCLSRKSDATSGYRACIYVAGTRKCPSISNGFDTGIHTYGGRATLPIGFAFPWNGATVTNMTVQSFGAVTFEDAALSSTNQPSALTSDPDDVVAVLWDDLDAEFAGAIVRYRGSGTAPNRRMVVRWDVGAKTNGATELATFSVMLEESGDLYMCYTDTTFGDSTVNLGKGATVGLFLAGHPVVAYNNFGVVDPNDELVWFRP
ncbi:MAG: hypothetical protein R3A78_05045 [Polyangiales bacterium]